MKSQKTIYAACLFLSFTGVCQNALAGAAGSPQISAYYTDYRQIPVQVLQQYLQRFADAPVHQGIVRSVALAGFGKAVNCSEPADFTPRGVVQLYGAVTPNFPLIFDADGNWERGIISERGIASGCGKTLIVNIHTFRRNGSIVSAFGMPGTTHVAPIIATGSLTDLAQALALRIGECRKVRYTEADFVGFIGEPNPEAAMQLDAGRPWRENYTVDICGQRVIVPVDYTPGPSATPAKIGVPVSAEADP